MNSAVLPEATRGGFLLKNYHLPKWNLGRGSRQIHTIPMMKYRCTCECIFACTLQYSFKLDGTGRMHLLMCLYYQCHDFQPLCHGRLVCHRWSTGVPWGLGNGHLIIGQRGIWSPLPAACCALSMVKKLMLCHYNFSALSVCCKIKRVENLGPRDLSPSLTMYLTSVLKKAVRGGQTWWCNIVAESLFTRVLNKSIIHSVELLTFFHQT